jgi:hypothetical protein
MDFDAVIKPLDRNRAAFSPRSRSLIFLFLLGDPQVEPVLQVLSLTILVGGVTRVPEALIQKDLQFGRLSIMGIITEVAVGVSITLAWNGWGVWSLVYGAVAGAVTNAVVAWWFLSSVAWVRLGNWDRGIIRQIASFGARIVGSASVYTLYSYTDNYVVGRVLGTESLGFYSKVAITSRTVDHKPDDHRAASSSTGSDDRNGCRRILEELDDQPSPFPRQGCSPLPGCGCSPRGQWAPQFR